MISKNSGNRRISAGSRSRRSASAEVRDRYGTMAPDVGRAIRGACHDFALAADWQQAPNGASHRKQYGIDDLVAGYRLTENHAGLHSGMYIDVTLLQAANALAIKGGRYDGYGQPETLQRESVPLREVTAKALSCLLTEMHDRLRRGHRA